MTETVDILAIETSTTLLGVAVSRGDQVIYEATMVKPRVHSAMLLPMCAAALEKTGIAGAELDAIAVSIGPGSFTGLRIGCSTAQGLAHAWGLPVVPVPTFLVLLEQAGRHIGREGVRREERTLVAIVQGKARAQTVAALYACACPADIVPRAPLMMESFTEVIPPGARSIEEFAHEMATAVTGKVFVTGDAAAEFADYCEGVGRDRFPSIELSLVGDWARLPGPGSLAVLATGMFREGCACPAKAAVPQYFRKSQAETVMARRSATRKSTG